MFERIRLPLLLTLLFGCLAQARAANLTVAQNGGQTQVLVGGREVARIGFAMATSGWHWVAGKPSGALQCAAPGSYSSCAIYPLTSGEVDVFTNVAVVGSQLNITVQATPTVSTSVATAHLSVLLHSAVWAGARCDLSSASLTLPTGNNQLSVYNGSSSVVSLLSRDGLSLRFDEPALQPLLIQDSRQWNSIFELRLANQPGSWPAGITRTFSALVSTDAAVPLTAESPTAIGGDSTWVPYSPSLDVVSGSALDWSKSTTPAAGSAGWVIVNSSGKLAFASKPSAAVRFIGANLVLKANFLSHSMADAVATRLARMGYNAVRLHHVDRDLCVQGSPGNASLDPSRLDQLHYLISALKLRGICTTISLYSLRPLPSGFVVPGTMGSADFEMLCLVNDQARQNWLQFVTNLLTAVNPYTGLAIKDDPAVPFLTGLNEDDAAVLSGQVWRSDVRAQVTAAYNAAGYAGTWSTGSTSGAKFGAALNKSTYDWMRSKLTALGCRSILTDTDGGGAQGGAVALARQYQPVVDNHFYWDHPQFLGTWWTLPSQGANYGHSLLESLGTLGNFAMTRMQGQPFVVTEYNEVGPNPYRAEAGLIFGAAGGIQGWDGLWRFDYSANDQQAANPGPPDYFDMITDPVALASERAAIALFGRCHLCPNLSANWWLLDSNNPPVDFTGATLRNEVLASPVGVSFFSGVVGGASPTLDTGETVSADGSVVADRNEGTLTVNTSKTKGVIGPEGANLVAGNLSVTMLQGRSVLFVSSLDRGSTSTSHRMLLTHLTDAHGTGSSFAGQSELVASSFGSAPILVRAGSAQVSMALNSPSTCVVYRLDSAGRRIATVPFTVNGSSVSFTASTDDPAGASFHYEIVQ